MSSEAGIRVRILQLGRRVVDHVSAPGEPLAHVLQEAGFGELRGMDVRVNGSPADFGQPRRDGDVVTIIPRIKGGSE